MIKKCPFSCGKYSIHFMYSFPLCSFYPAFNFLILVFVLLLLTANLWLIFKFTVSLANKPDELNMKKITIVIDGFFLL